MAADFKLGLVLETTDDKSSPIVYGSWNNFFNYVRRNKNIIAFDWKDVRNNKIEKYIVGDKSGKEMVYNQPINIVSSSDILLVKQLGNIGERCEDFLSFLDSLEEFVGDVYNPVPTMRNNLSKEYLFNLQDEGFPVIPSKRINCGYKLCDAASCDFDGRINCGLEDLVVKPEVFGEKGVGVRKISDFSNEEEFQIYLSKMGNVVLQPFMKEIIEDGEISLIYFGHEFSHGIRKKSGQFKVNNNGTDKVDYKIHIPSREEVAVCKDILDIWPDKIGYTRFDLIYKERKPLVSEVEMVNPSLYNNLINIDEELFPRLEKFLLENDRY